jgi:transposase
MAKTFRPYDPDQLRLMPPALADWVPEGHLARFVRDLVDDLDLAAIEDTYAEERGYPPYHPRMMVTVLLYAYCTGTYSSRKIAARLEDSVAVRFLAAENQPDFRTISDFRKRHSAALAALFTQVLRVCRQAGLVKLGRVAIDGTRMKANASKHKAMSYGRMVEKDAALQQEIAELLRRAEQIDRDEDAQHGPDRRGDELPAELARRESRRQKIREAKAALEAEAREQAARAGQDPTQATPHPKAQRNFTDPESKIQKTADGFIQGYNAQAAVDATAQVIVAQDVTPMAADVGHLLPLVTAIGRTLRQRPRQVLADAGYCSDDNLKALGEKGIAAYIATGRQTHDERLRPAPRGRPPTGLTRRERMARTLRTTVGRAIYARRKAIVEPVFGQIKHARGFRQFLRRGQRAVRDEWALLCTVHNILKLHTASPRP